jgi:hypothetical protein
MVSLLAAIAVVSSCEDQTTPRPVSLTGTWTGIAYTYSGMPEDPNPEIVLTLDHEGSTVSGTLSSIGIERTICSGSFRGKELVFTVRYEHVDVEDEFRGTLKGNRIEGVYTIRQFSTGEVYPGNTWYVERSH